MQYSYTEYRNKPENASYNVNNEGCEVLVTLLARSWIDL
jgi:hypothetical protein